MAAGDNNPRGFAAMSPERRRELAALGGRSVKPENRTWSRDQAAAKAAGRLGGRATKWKHDARTKGNLPL